MNSTSKITPCASLLILELDLSSCNEKCVFLQNDSAIWCIFDHQKLIWCSKMKSASKITPCAPSLTLGLDLSSCNKKCFTFAEGFCNFVYFRPPKDDLEVKNEIYDTNYPLGMFECVKNDDLVEFQSFLSVL